MGEKQRALPLNRMVADLWRTFCRDAFDSYRPEMHYMRGPGPKWREKHAAAPVSQPPIGEAAHLAA